jgi:signal transduction histidine kinase
MIDFNRLYLFLRMFILLKKNGFFLFTTLLTLGTSFLLGQTLNPIESEALRLKIDSVNSLPYDFIVTNPNKSESLFSEALSLSEKINYKKGMANSMSHLSLIYYFTGKEDVSVQYSIKALKIYEETNDLSKLAHEYGELGYRLKRRDLTKAFFYMQKGINIANSIKDTGRLSILYDNYGVLHEMNNDLDSALFFYSKSLSIDEAISDSVGMGYSLFNIANAYVLKKQFAKAELFWKRGLKIREQINNKIEIAESLSSIADFFAAENKYSDAVDYYLKALYIYESIDQLYYQQYCLQKLAVLYENKGEYETSINYLKRYILLKDSLFNIENTTRINALEIEFQTEKKEKEIIAQKLIAQNEVLKVKRRNYWIIIISMIALFSVSVFIILFKKQRYKQKKLMEENALKEKLAFADTEIKLNNERTRISRDLHDNLGAHLTFIISSIENILYASNFKTEYIHAKLKDVKDFAGETIALFRDTVWALSKNEMSLVEFKIRLLNFIEKVKKSNDRIQILISDSVESNIAFNSVQSINLFRVIQEAVNNAVKHAHAQTIEITFDRVGNNKLRISVKDNGNGFDQTQSQTGNGLSNMKSRMHEMNGTIEFWVDNGTQIRIELPV